MLACERLPDNAGGCLSGRDQCASVPFGSLIRVFYVCLYILQEGALQPVINLLSSTCPESQREAALLLGQFATQTPNDDGPGGATTASRHTCSRLLPRVAEAAAVCGARRPAHATACMLTDAMVTAAAACACMPPPQPAAVVPACVFCPLLLQTTSPALYSAGACRPLSACCHPPTSRSRRWLRLLSAALHRTHTTRPA